MSLVLASACFGFGFVQQPRVGPTSRPAHRGIGRTSLHLMAKELNRDELFAMMQKKPQGRPGRPAQRGPSKPLPVSELVSTQQEVAVGATLQLPYPVPFELLGEKAKGWLETKYLSPQLRLTRGNKVSSP